MSQELCVKAWLLKKVPLSNDDVLLICLTDTLGKISVFAPKLQRSKKKAAELDYFRFLELELSQPKQSFKLRQVKTLQDFSSFLTDYPRTQFAFESLALVERFTREEKPVRELMVLLQTLWVLQDLALPHLEIFFYTKLLWISGLLPRFDQVRSDTWLHPQTLEFSTAEAAGSLFLSNHQRQMAEWFRRVEAAEVIEKAAQFEIEDVQQLKQFLLLVLENH